MGMESKPASHVLGCSLKHIFSRGGTGAFQAIQDSSHEHESVLPIMASKSSEGLWGCPLVGLGHQVELEGQIKVDLNGSIDEEWPRPPAVAGGRV